MIFVKLRLTLIKSSLTEPHNFGTAMATEQFFDVAPAPATALLNVKPTFSVLIIKIGTL
jgi:hypothetical protein